MPNQILVLAEHLTFCVCGYPLWTRIRVAWVILRGKDIGMPPMLVAGQPVAEVVSGLTHAPTQGGANA